MENNLNQVAIIPDALQLDANFLTDNGAYIVLFNQDAPPLSESYLLSILSADELERMEQYITAKLQHRYQARRGVLRHLLGMLLGEDASDLRFIYGEHGKPAIAEHKIAFNMSHTRQYVIIAFSQSELGIDIEYKKATSDLEAITRTHFSPDEQAQWLSLPASQRLQGFYNAWTRKEAFIKMDGRGLQIPLDSFSVSLNPEEPTSILKSDVIDATNWRISTVLVPDAYASALVTYTHIKQVQLLWWQLNSCTK